MYTVLQHNQDETCTKPRINTGERVHFTAEIMFVKLVSETEHDNTKGPARFHW